jgi:hypothetical protein
MKSYGGKESNSANNGGKSECTYCELRAFDSGRLPPSADDHGLDADHGGSPNMHSPHPKQMATP